MMKLPLMLLLLALFLLQVLCSQSDYDFGSSVFEIDVTGNPEKAGNPKYSFTWVLEDGTSETYDVAWEKVYETPCANADNPSGNQMVNLNSLKWE